MPVLYRIDTVSPTYICRLTLHLCLIENDESRVLRDVCKGSLEAARIYASEGFLNRRIYRAGGVTYLRGMLR